MVVISELPATQIFRSLEPSEISLCSLLAMVMLMHWANRPTDRPDSVDHSCASYMCSTPTLTLLVRWVMYSRAFCDVDVSLWTGEKRKSALKACVHGWSFVEER